VERSLVTLVKEVPEVMVEVRHQLEIAVGTRLAVNTVTVAVKEPAVEIGDQVEVEVEKVVEDIRPTAVEVNLEVRETVGPSLKVQEELRDVPDKIWMPVLMPVFQSRRFQLMVLV